MLDYAEFKKKVAVLVGIDLANYKSQQMDRRIHSLMSAWKIETYEEFLELLRTDPRRFDEFNKKLTINVSEFFRNPERFYELWQQVLPQLVKERPLCRIWSAGCSNGSEPYSLAIIARELGMSGRFSILATDIDKMILAKAEQALYTAHDLKNLPPELLEKYFTPEDGNFRLREIVRRMVEFRHHDLLKEEFESDFDLILCRNVVIYFTEAAKLQLYTKFLHALRPGGLLLVGGTEPLLNYRQLGFESYMPSFYQRPFHAEKGASG